jgi:DNA mismatch repair protein MutS
VKQKAKTKNKPKLTPLMSQYFQIKKKHPEAVLLFRVGDFYETFGEDAVTTAEVLGIVLTSRNNGGSDIELAGFPYHSLDIYLPRLVKAGYRVAICEQLEKPSKEKKIVKRGVTDVITPGIAVDGALLDHKNNNFLASLHVGTQNHHGLALLDISTGEFFVSEGNMDQIDKLLQSFSPSEVILSKSKVPAFQKQFGDRFYHFKLDEWLFAADFGRERLLDFFKLKTLKGFGIEDLEEAQTAAGAILYYLELTENKNVGHIQHIQRIQNDSYVWLDRFTIRNLELVRPCFENGTSLIDVLDQTVSAMGSRLLKKWVVLPLKDISQINQRSILVEYFVHHPDMADKFQTEFRKMGDIERLISRVAMLRANPREIVQLKKALYAIQCSFDICKKSENTELKQMAESLHLCTAAHEKIELQLVDEPPNLIQKGGAIRDGFHEELDDLRNTVKNAKELLIEIQQSEATKTGISSLKVGFNNVFGYYLEVTNKYKNQGLVPDNWVRKQTLTGSERYITDELKKLEQKILTAQDRIQELELSIYDKLILALQEFVSPILHNASVVAKIDCLISFATVAIKNKYNKAEVNNSLEIDIKDGRHPVIENQLKIGDSYIPNDVYLDHETQQLLMITGPNMSGKSAFLRQTALICLMAQMGSFVPASSAKIGFIDKLFTRVGASDNITSGESTFMVEMNETASIMNNISERSLLLLDEIGRGTSTYDGISIAWSLAEFLHENPKARPKTLFATHYHELNDLANSFPRVKNYNVAIKESGNKIIFLHKLVAGGSAHSFGIHVAKMAGMPLRIIQRSTEILKLLESKAMDSSKEAGTKDLTFPSQEALQLSIFETSDPTAGKIKEALQFIDIHTMTPIECMLKLNELKSLLEED